ncbi:hypothetical protein ACT453_33510, partial [Bacillus sp. D-CC]
IHLFAYVHSQKFLYLNIYAAGDVIGGIQLAHVAFHEGTTAALHASGEDVKVNYHAVPRCIYTAPEIASVGLTEKDAREQYGDIQIGEFPFTANGKALIIGVQIGLVPNTDWLGETVERVR